MTHKSSLPLAVALALLFALTPSLAAVAAQPAPPRDPDTPAEVVAVEIDDIQSITPIPEVQEIIDQIDMARMMSTVVEAGTARRAQLDGIPAAGKTGTTNAYRDAWFAGYTGNFSAAVWYGNDDYTPTNRMTGGSLPAKTWHDIMVAAHQGVEIKDIDGVETPQRRPEAGQIASSDAKPSDAAGSPPVLTRQGANILVRIERNLDAALKSIHDAGKTPAPSSALPSQDSLAAAKRVDGAPEAKRN